MFSWGTDKLKANIGMNVRRRGEDSYLALLDAGCCWYEAGNTCEFYIQDGNSFELVVSPLHGRRGESGADHTGRAYGKSVEA